MPRPSAQTAVVDVRPEDKLLLCCARTRIDSETAERIKCLLREDVDWASLTGTAFRHGVMPLLYQSLHATCPEAVPKGMLRQLRAHFYANVERNLFLTGELLNLLNLLEAHRIPAVPFKGPVLAASVYGNLALRQFGDLDILVHRRDVLRAKTLLLSQGYWQERPPPQLTSAQEAARLRSHHEYTFVRDDGAVVVEIQWGVTQRLDCFPLDVERVWGRLETVSLSGTTVFNLSSEDLLLILCAHGVKHYWERLIWICDIAELVRARPQMDWGRVMEQARRLRSERTLYLSLHLASDLLGATLPTEILSRIQADPMVPSLAAQVRTWLFREPSGSPEASDPSVFPLSEKALFRLRVRERLRDRVPYFLQRLHRLLTPNERDRALLPLPTSLSFLYYLLRPLRLMGAYGGSPFKRLLRFLFGV